MTPASIAEFSREAAMRYLQSAVFIDDNIYNQVSMSPDEVVKAPRQPKAVMQSDQASEKVAESNRSVDSSEAESSPPPFKTKDLVGSFAEYGIVCALYEPEKEFSTDEGSTVFKLCQTADLVILDWDFHEVGVEGTKPKALIENLIRSGNRVAPHHVRLLVIYTNTQSLHFIANSILQHLTGLGMETDPVDDTGFRLQTGSSRVVVLGKAGGVARVEREQPFTVLEKDLAGRLLREFAAMNEGILPSCALLGMAAVRQNSRRILDKFRPALDAQFLLQRALIRSSEEAFDQLPELLGDEFRAVIEDSDFRPSDATTFVKESCAAVSLKEPPNPWKVEGKDATTSLREYWGEDNGLRKLLNGKKAAPADGDQPKKPLEVLVGMCSEMDADAHDRFAALLALRTQYQTQHRDLGFGAVILDRDSDRYSVCIIPICDSLRLKNQTDFPFWRLKTTGKGNPVIVQREDGAVLKLVFEASKPSSCLWMKTFTPDGIKGVVMAEKDAAGKYVFKAGGMEYEWIAQLKPSHAQRIANTIGQQLSRVGLTEAEWARIAYRSPEE